jgi:glycosyltransferase involved in cell wall biosynthesis
MGKRKLDKREGDVMRVLMIVSGFPDESNPARGIFNMRAYNQLSQAHEVDVIQVRMMVPGRKLFYTRTYKGINIRVFCMLPVIFKNLNSLPTLKLISKMFAARIKTKYDAVHCVSLGVTALLGSAVSTKMNIPNVVQLIGTDVNEELPNYSKALKEYFSKTIYAVGANSQQLINVFRKYMQVPVMQVIYRGVSVTQFVFDKDLARDNTILFLGGFVSSSTFSEKLNFKGGIDLLNVWKKNEVFFNKNNYTLLIGGPDTDNKVVTDWMNELQYRDNVKILGVIDQPTVKSLIEKTELAILPSHNEGMPNVAMEAMASGAIILASRVGGVPELITDGKTGFIFEPHDLGQIEKAIIKAINLPENEKQKIRINARRKVEEDFNSWNFAVKYSELYHSLKPA